MYSIYGVKESNREELCSGYDSKAHAYAYATKLVIDIRTHGNPFGWKALEVCDDKANVLPEYKDDSWLRV